MATRNRKDRPPGGPGGARGLPSDRAEPGRRPAAPGARRRDLARPGRPTPQVPGGAGQPPGVAERGFSLADAAEDDAADHAAGDFDGDGEDESDTGIVLVVPREANRGDVGAGPKAVVVSRGKIVGKQG